MDNSTRLNLRAILAVTFLALKVSGAVNWSWAIALIPIWLPIARDVIGLFSIWIIKRWR